MPWMFLGLGVTAGILSGLFGIGGGIVIVVGLLSVVKMPIHTAIGTSLAALLLPVGLFGVLEYYKDGHVNFNAALLIAAGLAVGVFIGAKYAQGLSPLVLQRAFAIFLLIMAARIWLKAA